MSRRSAGDEEALNLDLDELSALVPWQALSAQHLDQGLDEVHRELLHLGRSLLLIVLDLSYILENYLAYELNGSHLAPLLHVEHAYHALVDQMRGFSEVVGVHQLAVEHQVGDGNQLLQSVLLLQGLHGHDSTNLHDDLRYPIGREDAATLNWTRPPDCLLVLLESDGEDCVEHPLHMHLAHLLEAILLLNHSRHRLRSLLQQVSPQELYKVVKARLLPPHH
eukprot:CAMPEP_0168627326 /NCGR_PEP_ID=MMETSP0449_2-20121227/11174_1 /TAXON_ID=1082188 /ORGANISM="Strombidium rassoulzadegani, Strain ras09" /LENGTH=221 /DNA_ID=CAMNT_0008669517 /DNA_START=133 /DNA_END=796 /DNA_ORIENTATION=-